MELQEILELWRRARSHGESIYLATLIHVEGSSYRKPGSRMLVTSGGKRAGTISGGCLEAEVSKKVAWLTADGAVVKNYRTSFEEDGAHPYGSGCGGTVWLLLESGERAESVLQTIAAAWEQRESSVALYELCDPFPISIHRGIDPDQEIADPTRMRAIETALRSGDVVAGSTATDDLLPDFICVPSAPPPHLYVFGAGDDARPLVAIASQLGWHVTVADGRENLLRKDRFPTAWKREVLHYHGPSASIPDEAGDLVVLPAIHERDLAVVLTHSFDQDRAILKVLLNRPLLYIGVLGPRQRTQRLLESIGMDEDAVAAAFTRIYSPVGLSIGAKDPSTIALAILAEMQAKLVRKAVTIRDEQQITEETPPGLSGQSAHGVETAPDRQHLYIGNSVASHVVSAFEQSGR